MKYDDKTIIILLKGSIAQKEIMDMVNEEPYNDDIVILEKSESEFQEFISRVEAAKIVDNSHGKFRKPSSKDFEFPF
ncbi:hypothetical protein [Flavobacterium petrolei]|uniref:hypothetical protein n=1 Tax=Flavobacterium petrolei TaxID=2259594 RepID=UPI003757DB37